MISGWPSGYLQYLLTDVRDCKSQHSKPCLTRFPVVCSKVYWRWFVNRRMHLAGQMAALFVQLWGNLLARCYASTSCPTPNLFNHNETEFLTDYVFSFRTPRWFRSGNRHAQCLAANVGHVRTIYLSDIAIDGSMRTSWMRLNHHSTMPVRAKEFVHCVVGFVESIDRIVVRLALALRMSWASDLYVLTVRKSRQQMLSAF